MLSSCVKELKSSKNINKGEFFWGKAIENPPKVDFDWILIPQEKWGEGE